MKMKPSVNRMNIWSCSVTLLAAAMLLAAGSLPAAAQGRVVAVGDIHGDAGALAEILRSAGLVDATNRWIGGNAVLVQTGDLLDRGPHDRRVMDLLMELELRAPRSGGRVITLLGNHEVMNVIGDLRYVAPESYAGFAGPESEKRREAAFREWVSWQRERARRMGLAALAMGAETRLKWMQERPAGFIEHREAFAPDGRYGQWLRGKDVITQVDGTVFLHGGIHPRLAGWSLERLNGRVRSELREFDRTREYLLRRKVILPFFTLEEMNQAVSAELTARRAELQRLPKSLAPAGQQSAAAEGLAEGLELHLRQLESFLAINTGLAMDANGPLWYRGFADWDDAEGARLVGRMLKSLGASHFVVGHTIPDNGRIFARFDGRVFLIDTGMHTAAFPHGRPSALEIAGGRFTAIYQGERAVLLDRVPARTHSAGQFEEFELLGGGGQEPAAPAQNSNDKPKRVWYGLEKQPLPFQSDEEVLQFLRNSKPGKARGAAKGTMGVRRVELELGGVRAAGYFRDMREEKDRAQLASGQTVLNFRDDYIFECAAYELAGMLGLDNVPPTVERRLFGSKGTLQIGIGNVLMDEQDRQKKKVTPPRPLEWNRQVQVMRAFDVLIDNFDRNMQNILIDEDWNLWMIDHTRAFTRNPELRTPVTVAQIERGVFEKLKALGGDEVRQRLDPYLRRYEIEALLKRRDALVAHFEKLIAERGENAVLFSWETPPPAN